MKRIVFAKLKGGVGASCSLLCLGMYLAKVGRHSVACLDLDEAQQTAANMLENLGGLIDEYEGGNSHDYLLIDSGAGLPSAELKRHMAKADLIVVPARPSSIDWNSTFTFLEKLSPTLRKKTRLLFTNVMPNTKLAGDLPEMRQHCLDNYGVGSIPTTMNLRTGYAMAMTVGWSALPKAAKEELAALATQVATAA